MGNLKLHSEDIVAIKPNLCCIKSSETGATTDLRVVEGIVRYFQEKFHVTDISIVESDGTQLQADMAFKLLGYEKLARKLNLKLVNLTKDKFSYKVFEDNVSLKKVKYPEVLARANCLISVPKIKIHTMCCFGGTMKNQFGCNPFPQKSVYHKDLHNCLVDLSIAFKPQLIVVDGIVGMEGRGPVGGLPVKMNALVFGRDVVAVDHLIAKIIGVNPDKVKYLIEARKRGLGTINYCVVGASPKEIERKFNQPPGRRNLYGLFSM